MITRREANLGLISSAAVLVEGSLAAAEQTAVIQLPEARGQGGKPLIEALGLRRSTREYSPRPLPPQVLSDLLWAAFGINRPATGDRTAPYWRHIMAIDVYAAMANGVWIYEARGHRLLRHSPDDLRAQTGTQDFAAGAPLNLVYIAHGERMGGANAEDKRLYASVDVGFIGENVYLFCASEGLETVFRAALDYNKLAQILRLDAGQFVAFAQTVEYPAQAWLLREPKPEPHRRRKDPTASDSFSYSGLLKACQ